MPRGATDPIAARFGFIHDDVFYDPPGLSTDAPTTDFHDGLVTIIAQTVQFETLPDWDVYRVACDAVQDSVEDAIQEAI